MAVKTLAFLIIYCFGCLGFNVEMDIGPPDCSWVNAGSPGECQGRCQADSCCHFWTYVISEGRCYKKAAGGPQVSKPNDYTSGPKHCPP